MAFAENIANTLQLEMENQVTLFEQLAELPEVQSADPAVCNKKLDELFLTYGNKLTNIGRMNAKGIFDCSHNRAAIGTDGPKVAAHLKQIIEDPEHRPVLGRLIPPAAGTVSASPVTSFHVHAISPLHVLLYLYRMRDLHVFQIASRNPIQERRPLTRDLR